MQVFTLPDTRQYNVLLTGDTDFVLEFAQRLDAAQISFRILPPMDELDELDMELDIVDPEMNESALDPEEYGTHADRVIGDVRNEAGTFTHIVELSVAPSIDRKTTLEISSTVNPKATVIVSALTNTVTEMGLLSGTANRVVGVTLAPSIITSATRIDVAGGLNTRGEHVERANALLRTMGYETEVVEDRVALVQMRVLAMLINEAAFAVMEGVATPADIDQAMKLGVNYPKGLLAWADEIGLPVVALILDGLYREYQQERYRPCVLLKQYMRAGWTGKTAGRGFYQY
jgi:3-hydroxybutyryl-CoA dehydrogenase